MSNYDALSPMAINYKTEVKHGEVMFTIGNQSFRLAYNPDDDDPIEQLQSLEWMRKQLNHALDSLANSI